MLQKVEACYRDLNFTPDTTPYSQFIKYLSQINTNESDEYWRSELSETSAAQFPPLPRPAYQVTASRTSKCTSLVSRESGSHITLPSTIRAAWALVVGIYSGNMEDIIFAETLTGRDAPVEGIEHIIGPTLATVPTRIRINQTTTIAKFLEDVQSISTQFQYAGLQKIRHISEDTRSACDALQNLLAIHHDNKEPSDGFWDLRSSGTVGTNFYSYGLTISCQIGEGVVDIEAMFDQDVISNWQVERMLSQFDYIIKYLNSPDTKDEKLSEMKMLNPFDQETIWNWNHEPVNAVNKCIHNLIEQQVCNKIAVHSWDATLTYRELEEASTRLAQRIITQNIQQTPIPLVPLVFEKSAFTIVAMYALLKCGMAFVPLDPTAPSARLRQLIGDTKAELVLCSSKYEKLCSNLISKRIVVDAQLISATGPIVQIELPPFDSTRPAYIIFTSGTTGKPKVLPPRNSAINASKLGDGLCHMIERDWP
jgi:hypothetical protein